MAKAGTAMDRWVAGRFFVAYGPHEWYFTPTGTSDHVCLEEIVTFDDDADELDAEDVTDLPDRVETILDAAGLTYAGTQPTTFAGAM